MELLTDTQVSAAAGRLCCVEPGSCGERDEQAPVHVQADTEFSSPSAGKSWKS